MKLKTFHEGNKKKQMIIIGGMIVFLLMAGILIYRTYAIYQEKQDFDVIKGNVPEQNYDVMISYEVKDEHGNINSTKAMPEGAHWAVDVSCNYGEGYFDYDQWNVVIQSKDSRTKCKLIFTPNRSPLKEYGIRDPLVESGEGLYEVRHNGVDITSPVGDYAKKGFSYTEYRYAGKDPNNYVLFNDELWRIIGLVNTPEGKRLKLIRSESIGSYVWDSSDSNVNAGNGVNEWSKSKIRSLLNGVYYKRTSGTCYTGPNNESAACDFTNNGLTDASKGLIDVITWNTGAVFYRNSPAKLYIEERGINLGNTTTCENGEYCTDTITRNTTWKGSVGLIYASDYGYATIGGNTYSREQCLSTSMSIWHQRGDGDCYNNNWLYIEDFMHVISPLSTGNRCDILWVNKNVGQLAASIRGQIYPTIYLKSNIKVDSGQGSAQNPYHLNEM